MISRCESYNDPSGSVKFEHVENFLSSSETVNFSSRVPLIVVGYLQEIYVLS
jgi:hypothetical protein